MDDNIYSPPGSSLEGEHSVRNRFGTFQFDQAMSEGWSSFTEQIPLSIGFIFVWFILLLFAAVSVIGWIVIPHLSAGLVMYGLNVARRRGDFGSMFLGFNSFGSVLGAAILLFLIGLAVSLLFYLPAMVDVLGRTGGIDAILSGDPEVMERLSKPTTWDSPWAGLSYLATPIQLYFNARFLLAFPLIIERDFGIVDSLKASWSATASVHLFLMLFMLLISIISGSGILICCVGILFTLPLGYAIQGTAIRQLLGEMEPEKAERNADDIETI